MSDLHHYGIKGMKWGVRRTPAQLGYRSTGIKSAVARRQNAKIDKSFKDWDENTKKRDAAIDLGKKANAARLAYERNPTDKSLKNKYSEANAAYKKALKENTTYRKGVVRKEVGKDASRKYLSEAKKVKKQLDQDPANAELRKKYDKLMSAHNIERADARRATDVSTKRMTTKANIKRKMTKTMKSAAITAATAIGATAVNRYLSSHDVRINDKRVSIGSETLADLADLVKKGQDFLSYLY